MAEDEISGIVNIGKSFANADIDTGIDLVINKLATDNSVDYLIYASFIGGFSKTLQFFLYLIYIITFYANVKRKFNNENSLDKCNKNMKTTNITSTINLTTIITPCVIIILSMVMSSMTKFSSRVFSGAVFEFILLLIFKKTILNFIHNIAINSIVNMNCSGDLLCSNDDIIKINEKNSDSSKHKCIKYKLSEGTSKIAKQTYNSFYSKIFDYEKIILILICILYYFNFSNANYRFKNNIDDNRLYNLTKGSKENYFYDYLPFRFAKILEEIPNSCNISSKEQIGGVVNPNDTASGLVNPNDTASGLVNPNDTAIGLVKANKLQSSNNSKLGPIKFIIKFVYNTLNRVLLNNYIIRLILLISYTLFTYASNNYILGDLGCGKLSLIHTLIMSSPILFLITNYYPNLNFDKLDKIYSDAFSNLYDYVNRLNYSRDNDSFINIRRLSLFWFLGFPFKIGSIDLNSKKFFGGQIGYTILKMIMTSVPLITTILLKDQVKGIHEALYYTLIALFSLSSITIPVIISNTITVIFRKIHNFSIKSGYNTLINVNPIVGIAVKILLFILLHVFLKQFIYSSKCYGTQTCLGNNINSNTANNNVNRKNKDNTNGNTEGDTESNTEGDTESDTESDTDDECEPIKTSSLPTSIIPLKQKLKFSDKNHKIINGIYYLLIILIILKIFQSIYLSFNCENNLFWKIFKSIFPLLNFKSLAGTDNINKIKEILKNINDDNNLENECSKMPLDTVKATLRKNCKNKINSDDCGKSIKAIKNEFNKLLEVCKEVKRNLNKINDPN